MALDLPGELDLLKLEIKEVVQDVTLLAEFEAKERIPLGPSDGTLRDSVQAQIPIEKGGLIIGVLTAFAEDRGFDYASFQHDEPLRHVSPETDQGSNSFAEFGTSGSSFERYRQGYQSDQGRKVQNKYALKFFDKALEAVDPELNVRLGALL